MPELPEVETVRRGLDSFLRGREIKSVTHDNPKSFPNYEGDVSLFMIGASVKAVNRRAKLLLIELSSMYTLVVHLRMTGQMVFDGSSASNTSETKERFGAGHPSDSLVGLLPDKSTRVEITFTDNTKLFFNDQRKFGWMQLLPSAEVEEIPFVKKLGPEPLDPSTKPEEFIQRIRRRNSARIKPAILDQSVIAGVGNIYADESLWIIGTHPETRVSAISDEKLLELFQAIIDVFILSIEKGGSTDRNYVDAEGRKGSYLSFANVYSRVNEPCRRHPDVLIHKIRVAGRGTHICPACQILDA